MTAATVLQPLRYAVAAGFLLLGLACVRDWARQRDRSHGWLAVALGLLGVTALLGLLPQQAPLAFQLLLAAFMGSGYALVRFRACFLPHSRNRLRLVTGVVVGGTLLALVALPSGANAGQGVWPIAVLGLLVLIWSACVGEPAIRFWLASRHRPPVERARMRALSIGYGGIVGLLAFAVPAGYSKTGVAVVTQIAALAIVPVLYAGFAPPSWLRRMWRAGTEDSLLRATGQLLMFSSDRRSLLESALEWSTRLVGADAGLIASRQGTVLAARHLAPADAESLARQRGGPTGPGPGVRRRQDRLVVVPIAADPDAASLMVLAGLFTPVFGSDEVASLERYVALVALALSRVRLVEDLGQQKERYETLLQHVSDMDEGLVWSVANRITYANEAFARMTGYTPEELSNLASPLDLVAPEHRERKAAERLDATAEPSEAVRDEWSLLTRDGHRLEVESVIRRRLAGGVLDTIAIIRDVTARRRAERVQVTRSAVATTLASAATWAVAAPSVMSSICRNQGWDLAEYWSADAGSGLRREHVWRGDAATLALDGAVAGQGLLRKACATGAPVWDAGVPEDVNGGGGDGNGAARGGVAIPIASGQRTAGVLALYSREMRGRDQETEAALVDIGGRIGDFLDRRRAEIAIRDLNVSLELRVAERTASNNELEAFVYTVSHDLRAPLRAIDGFVGALIEDYGADLSSGAREFLDDVAANARQMARLIEDLLAFSRLNRVLPKRHEVDPGEIASRVMERLRPELAGRHVNVAIDRLPSCSADPALLSVVYTNLLANAAKYSRRRDPAEIHVGCHPDAAGVAYFVKDNGIGFDPAYMNKLFGVFERLHSAAEYEGTGVGLAIVKRIVERHGGTVWAESAVDQGATFFFRLQEAAKP
jgi:PAS domain S-box-containing protein